MSGLDYIIFFYFFFTNPVAEKLSTLCRVVFFDMATCNISVDKKPLFTRVFTALYLCGSTPFGWVGSGWVEWDGAAFSWISKPCMVGWGIPHILGHHDLKAFQRGMYEKETDEDTRRPAWKRTVAPFLFCNAFLSEIKWMRYFRAAPSQDIKVEPQLTVEHTHFVLIVTSD